MRISRRKKNSNNSTLTVIGRFPFPFEGIPQHRAMPDLPISGEDPAAVISRHLSPAAKEPKCKAILDSLPDRIVFKPQTQTSSGLGLQNSNSADLESSQRFHSHALMVDKGFKSIQKGVIQHGSTKRK